MKMELAEFLVKATNHVGKQEIDIREHYSGRGMFGSNTCGVVVDNVPQLLLDIAQYVKEKLETADGDLSEIDTLTDELPDTSGIGVLRTDNMGHKTILY